MIWDVIVIGGGAAGLMAAGRAAQLGARVLLLEKTDMKVWSFFRVILFEKRSEPINSQEVWHHKSLAEYPPEYCFGIINFYQHWDMFGWTKRYKPILYLDLPTPLYL